MRKLSRFLLVLFCVACGVTLSPAFLSQQAHDLSPEVPALFGLALPCLEASPALAGGATGPRFTWASFRFFWNKHTDPGVMLNNPTKVREGYLCEYGYTVSVLVLTGKGDSVHGVRVRYLGGPGNDAGGPKFSRLVQHAIQVGTFRWPEDTIAECREHFKTISKVNKEFRYQGTEFSMTYSDSKGWTFSLIYMQ